MPIDVTSLTTLDPAVVKEREQLLIQMLTEAFPTLDFTQGGILQQLLTHPNTVLDVVNRTEIDNLKNSMSLKTINDNPDIADQDIVDAVLSNYMVSRTAATSASGTIAIVIDSLTTVTIPMTTNFVANGRTFNPVHDYIAVTNAALVVDAYSRLVRVRPDGKYWFSLDVVENVTQGTSLVQGVAFEVDPLPSNFDSAYAAADFQAGLAAEDNAALVAKMAGGVTATVMSDRQAITTLLKSEFPSVSDVSIIGYSDPEMSRDRNNIFGVGHGSKSDVIIRTGALPTLTKFSVLAPILTVAQLGTKSIGGVSPNEFEFVHFGDGAASDSAVILDIPIAPVTAPGFYRIEKLTVMDPSSTALELTDIHEPATRGIYRPTAAFVPAISLDSQARYSMYQGNTVVRVTDPAPTLTHRSQVLANIAGLTSVILTVQGQSVEVSVAQITELLMAGYRFYDVYVSSLPALTSIQDYLNERQHQAPVADYLVKAAIPCFVSAEVTVGYKTGTQAPDVATVQSAVAEAINSVLFSAADLQASNIIDYVAGILQPAGYLIMPINLTGVLYSTDGTTQVITSQNSLVIPDIPDLGISRRTVAYYAYPEDVIVTLRAVSSWGV